MKIIRLPAFTGTNENNAVSTVINSQWGHIIQHKQHTILLNISNKICSLNYLYTRTYNRTSILNSRIIELSF